MSALVSTEPVGCPPPVSLPFLHSVAAATRLKVGVLMDGAGMPSYGRSILGDLLRADFVDLALVVVASPSKESGGSRGAGGMAFRAYAAYLESRYQAEPDPLDLVDCTDLFARLARMSVEVVDSEDSRVFPSEAIARISATRIDVLLDFGTRPARGAAVFSASQGVWRYHFGDSRKYPAGSGFLRELVDRSPLSGIELVKLGPDIAHDQVLMRALFSTVPFLSRKANRFGPIWGSRHFVIQSLWNFHNGRFEPLANAASADADSTSAASSNNAAELRPRGLPRVPGNLEIARWIADETSRRLLHPLWHKTDGWRWRIGIRRAETPLFLDTSTESLRRFHWIDNPAGQYWADPFLFDWQGTTWIFFEQLEARRRLGEIHCGRLTEDGRLVDTRCVLRRDYHLSYPQLIVQEDQVFMLPEAAQSGGLDLYRATRFPDEWVLEKRLLDFRCVDSSPFYTQEAWWIACSPQVVPGNVPITWLFSAAQLAGPWKIHPASPIASDARMARGAGAIFSFEGRLFRPSQDCSVAYGKALLFNEIVALDANQYVEKTIGRIDAGWTAGLAGVHTYSRNANWEAIDGGFK